MKSPETYIGYRRAENFTSTGGEAQDKAHTYTAPTQPALNEWELDGKWKVGEEHATLAATSGRIVYRFHARDLHLVLDPDKDSKPVRFRVSIDGAAPGAAHGTDVAADGTGTVTEQRLYQLVRQTGDVADHTFSIKFLDPGVQAFAITFGQPEPDGVTQPLLERLKIMQTTYEQPRLPSASVHRFSGSQVASPARQAQSPRSASQTQPKPEEDPTARPRRESARRIAKPLCSRAVASGAFRACSNTCAA